MLNDAIGWLIATRGFFFFATAVLLLFKYPACGRSGMSVHFSLSSAMFLVSILSYETYISESHLEVHRADVGVIFELALLASVIFSTGSLLYEYICDRIMRNDK